MAARNTADGKHFIHRSPTKEPDVYFVPANGSRSNIVSKTSQPSTLPLPTTIRSADVTTPRTELVNPARRVVVIRNTKHPQSEQTPVDLGVFERSHSAEKQPVISNGHKSVYLIRRPIVAPSPSRLVEDQQPVQEPFSTASLEYRRTPTPPIETVTSPEQPRTPSPRVSPPIQHYKHRENVPRYAPYLRRSRSKIRTTSPHNSPPELPLTSERSTSPKHSENTQRRVPSLRRSRSKTRIVRRSPSPSHLEQEESTDADGKRRLVSAYWFDKNYESHSPLPSEIVEHDQREVQHHRPPPAKSAQRQKSSVSRAKSAKSVVFVNPDDQSIVVVENSHIKGESLRPVIKHPKSIIKTRSDVEYDDESTAELVKTSQKQTCLGCLSKYMCLIVIICFIIILIGLAGIGVSAYFLATNSSSNQVATIVGIAVGAVLVIAALCFLYIVLACIGSRDGYFSYDDDDKPNVGGRAFAIIPPSHPNARLYIPREYMKMVENSYPPPPPPMKQTHVTSASNVVHNQPTLTRQVSTMPYTHQQTLTRQVSTIPYTHQQTVQRTNTATNGFATKSNKKNITIEMPEHLVADRTMSPRTRERSLNKIVQNVGHVVEDARKRYNGDVPNKVIVTVDQHAKQTD